MSTEELTKFLINNPQVAKDIEDIRNRILKQIPCALLKPKS